MEIVWPSFALGGLIVGGVWLFIEIYKAKKKKPKGYTGDLVVQARRFPD